MLETQFNFTQTDEKTIERVVQKDAAWIIHMILNKGEFLAEHPANSNVFMIVVRGTITLQLADQEAHQYESGSIVNIPHRTLMNVSNQNEETLEFFVVKAPGPNMMKN